MAVPILTVRLAVLPSKAATVAVLLLAVLTVWLAVRLAVPTVLLAVATSASLMPTLLNAALLKAALLKAKAALLIAALLIAALRWFVLTRRGEEDLP